VRILTRYLVARFLGTFLALLLVSIVTIVIVEMMLNLGDMLRGDGGLADIYSYLILRLPAYYLRDLVPIAAFGGAFLAVGSAARWLELLAAKAGGISPHRLAAPLVVAGALLSVGAFVLNETLVLEATRRWNQRDEQTNPIRFREGSFWYQRGRTIYNIADADRSTNTLRGVRIFELDARGRLLRSIEAPRARIDAQDRFHFEAPRVRRFDPDERSRGPQVEDHTGEVMLALRDQGAEALMNADIATLSVSQLSGVVRRQRREGDPDSRPIALLHARLAEPLAVALFVLVAVPLGARAEPGRGQGMTVAALLGIAAIALFFGLRSAVDSLTASGLLPPSPAHWVLVAAFGGFAGWRYQRMPA
jgi:lipopolysaccharide export system permease protein